MIASLSRRRQNGIDRLTLKLDVPRGRWNEVVEAISGVLAEAAAEVGHTVGCIGIVDGEEPILVALAPRRDPIAERARSALTSVPPHRYSQLWVTLTPGTYLAQMVDPRAPFEFDERRLLGQLRSGAIGLGARFEVVSGVVSERLCLVAYGRRRELSKPLALAHDVLSSLSDWRTVR